MPSYSIYGFLRISEDPSAFLRGSLSLSIAGGRPFRVRIGWAGVRHVQGHSTRKDAARGARKGVAWRKGVTHFACTTPLTRASLTSAGELTAATAGHSGDGPAPRWTMQSGRLP